MKKTVFLLGCIAIILACNSSDSSRSTTTENDEAHSAEDPEVTKGLELVAKSDCFTCHKVVEPFTGPAYEAVAAKYPDNEAVIDSLSKKIINGGVGNWGAIPMTPHPNISEADARAMTKYVLSLK